MFTPQVHGDRGWFTGRERLPVLRGTLVHITAERLPHGRGPHRQMWLWHAGPGPLSLDELWRAYLARFDIEHAIRTLKATPGLTAAKIRAGAGRPLGPGRDRGPGPAPARPPPRRQHAPPPGRSTPTRPDRYPLAGPAAGSATSAAISGPPPVSRNLPDPDPAGPKEAPGDPRPATFSQAKPTRHAPRTRP